MAHAAAGDHRMKRQARGVRGWLLGECSRVLVMLVLLALARTSPTTTACRAGRWNTR